MNALPNRKNVPMTFRPIGKPDYDVTVIEYLPAQYAYATHQLQGASARSLVWKDGAIMIQSVPVGASSFHLYQIYVKEQQLLTVTVPEAITALWMLMKGNALVFTEGVGQQEFHEGECVLAHSPAAAEHYMGLMPGMHQFACVTLPGRRVRDLAAVNSQLAYFSACALTDENPAITQLAVTALPERDALLRQLIDINYHHANSSMYAMPIVDKLLSGYVQRLRKTMRSKRMNDGMVPLAIDIQAYIGRHFHEHLTTGYLARHFKVSDFTIDTAFSSITNQTIKQYVLEQQMLAARDYLRCENASVKCCANAVGMSDTCLNRHYKRRFGCAPSALLKRRIY